MNKLFLKQVISIKKITSLFLLSTLVLFFSNCSNDELIEPENTEEKVQKRTGKKDPIVLTVNEFEVSEEAAVLVAQNFAAINAHENGRSDIKPPTVKNINRIEDEFSKKPLLYIIEYAKGFSIVSADTRYNPILAYSDENTWGGADLAGPDIMIKRYTSAIKEIKAKGDKQDKRLKGLWSKMFLNENKGANNGCNSEVTSNTYGPYTHAVATWRQGRSFSTFSPNDDDCSCNQKAAGCGPVALSQLMMYHQFPNWPMFWGGETIPTDYANWSRTWGDCNSTNPAVRGPAMLTRLCGQAMNSNYGVVGNCSTATYPWKIKNGLNAFGYTHDGKGRLDNRYNAVINDLKNDRPVIISGTTGGLDLSDWHIWIVDGYHEVTIEYFDGNDCITLNDEYMFMNWGWGGQSNSWYYMNPNGVDDYDTYMRVYTNIRP